MIFRDRTQQADFFFRFCFCESIGLRREASASSLTIFVSDEISLLFALPPARRALMRPPRRSRILGHAEFRREVL